jgi:NitT/TauT family transport system substrate-binding protein
MQVIVPAWLRHNGVDAAAVKLMQLDPAVVASSLVEGRIDAGECWLGNSVPVYRKRAQEAGVTLGMLEYAAFGLDLYGSGLVTTDALIASEPQTVQGFVDATLAGYGWAIANPDAAVQIMLKHNPALEAGITRAQLDELGALLGSEGQRGRLDAARVQNSVTFLDAAYTLAGKVTAADVFTTRFVDGAGAPGG